MAKTILAFDLEDADAGKYKLAHEFLKKLGFTQVMPSLLGVEVPLPESTVLGDLPQSSQEIREAIWELLEKAELNPKRLIVGKCHEATWQGRW